MSRSLKPKEGPLDAPRKLALVSWEDAFYDDNVHAESDIQDEESACVLYSVGFYIGDSKKYVKLSMDYGNSTYRHTQRILKKNIKSIQFIGEEAGAAAPETCAAPAQP